MSTLVFVAGPLTARARARQGEGARLLAWDDAAGEALAQEGIPHASARELLSLEDRDEADEAAIEWTRQWGRRPLVDGKSFRELHAWKGVSLWWFAELFLHHSTPSPGRVRKIEALHRLLEREAPAEVEASGLSREDALLLARTCLARGILCHAAARPDRVAAWLLALRRGLDSRLYELKTLVTALKAARAGRVPPPVADGRTPVLFLSHAAFWRERPAAGGDSEEYEHYFDRLIPEAARSRELSPLVVAVGPRAAFRRRGGLERLREWLSLGGAEAPYLHVNRFVSFATLGAVHAASAEMRRSYALLRRSPALAEAFAYRGVRFDDLALPDLAGTLLLQVPWAVRCYEEMASVLARAQPGVVCLYAESSGWGRAALAACRAAAVPTLGIQHGILYPKYYSYRHAEDEADCPRPDYTAVFGNAARRFLIDAGHYPPESLVVTGSPKFDALLEAAATWNRAELRSRLGVAAHERLLVVASRFRGIRDTHQSIGSAFPALLQAVEGLPRARLIVKPHPAESAHDYERVLRMGGSTRAALAPPGLDLVQLLFAAEALVTVESLSAVEALVLDRPVLILNMPTNLREMVEAGVALGVPAGADPAPALRAMLDDEATRGRLLAARSLYLADVASGVDGRASSRLLGLMTATAALARRPATASGEAEDRQKRPR